MKKLVVFAVFLTACVHLCGPASAAGPAKDASDLFLRAYLQIQEGDGAFDKGDFTAAQARYKDALAVLKDIQAVQPDWNPHIISFRERYCDQRIAEAKARLAGGGAAVKPPVISTTPSPVPTASAPAPVTPPPVGAMAGAPGSSQPSADLSQELERLRDQVRRMQAERATAPPAPAPVVAPAPAPKPVAADNEQVKKLETELADMRKQLQQFIGEKMQTPPPVVMPNADAQRVTEMTDQIATLRSQLQQLLAERAQWEQSRQDLARLQAERSSLLAQLQEKDQRLAAGPSVLDASQSKALTEQLAQSARTIEALRSESKQLSLELSTARSTARDNATKVAQLVPLTDQLKSTKAEIAKIREELAAKDQQLAAKQQAIVAKSQDAARAELQLKEMTSLQQSNANLRLSLSKIESLIIAGKNREQESATRMDRLKLELEEVKGKLNAARGKEAEVAKLRDELAAKNREAGRAQDKTKDLASLRLSMSKAEALVSVAMDRERESAAQLDTLKQQLKKAQTQGAGAAIKPAKPVVDPPADRAATAQVEEMKRKMEEAERRAAAERAKADRAAAAQVEELKRKMEEADRRATAAAKDRATLAKEKDLLQQAVDKKTAEQEKTAATAAADRKKLAALEKKYTELNHQVSVLEMSTRKLSPEEEAFLKRTEVLVQHSSPASVRGEINANVRRAKDRALAQAAALKPAASIPPAPAPKFAQATPPAESRVASDATNTAVRTTPSARATEAPRATGAGPDAAVLALPPVTANTPPPAARSATPEIPAELKPLVDEARELFSQKKFEEAAGKYREILKRDPENLFGLSNLAVIRFQQERLEEAEHLLNRALQIAPDDAYSHATIGIIYFKQDRTDDAIEALTRALKLNPGNVEAHNYLGIACWKKGWRSAAEQELRRAIEMRPDYADAHYNLAVIYATQKPPFLGLAKFHYRKTLDLGRPRDPNLEKTIAGEKQ